MSQTAYRLGLDMGTNSIGWCAAALGEDGRPGGILDLGVRILTTTDAAGRKSKKDKKSLNGSGESLAVGRRVARGQRRRRDRHLRRKTRLMNALIRHGLMPEDEGERRKLEKLDPYVIRADALDKEVPLHHFGRALFHLHQRRGFKSNRKSDRADEQEARVIKRGIESLREKMGAEGVRTVGEFLARRHANRNPVRARMAGSGKDKDKEYPFYLERSLVAAEFDKLWNAQSQHHAALTKEAKDEIYEILFHQRPLKPVEPGKCALYYEEDDKRAPWALPIAQRFRILKELANLRLQPVTGRSRPLTLDERKLLLDRLLKSPKLTFDQMRGPKLLNLDKTTRFNLEDERRKELKGDESAARLGREKTLGKKWRALGCKTHTKIIELLLDAKVSDDQAKQEISALLPDADDETCDAIVACPMPRGHSRYGRRALRELVDCLEAGSKDHEDRETGETWQRPIMEYEARKAMGFSDPQAETLQKLPYYGEVLSDAVSGTGKPKDRDEIRLGRLPNPTVHIALNQLRHLVNAIIAEYGPPAEIAVELARELKLSGKRKEEEEKQRTKNQKDNERRRACLENLGKNPNSKDDMLRLRLYDELPDPLEGKLCVYSGKPICVGNLFDGTVEVDHILPVSRTWDNSFANKVLCVRGANQRKGNRTPAECFDPEELAAVRERASRLPKEKRWRFEPDAMERLEDDKGRLSPKLLTDTQYMTKLARRYLQHICPPDRKVLAPKGWMTGRLRDKWGLNSLLSDHNAPAAHPKNRNDHRHHAIDAFVTAVADHRLIWRIQEIAKEEQKQGRDPLRFEMPEPWAGFREELRRKVDEVVVSHRPDHGIQGRLHEDTAYGLVTEVGEDWILSYRKSVDKLTAGEMQNIRDRKLRTRVARELGASGEKKKRKVEKEKVDKARELLKNAGHRRIKLLLKKNRASLIKIHHGSKGRDHKVYITGDFLHHMDIFKTPDGSWDGEGVSVYQANKPGYRSKWMNRGDGARLVMRLHKGDMVEVECDDGQRRIMRVDSLHPSADRVQLAGHQEAGALDKRHKENNEIDPFRWFWPKYAKLKKRGARQVRVDLLGRVHAVEYD